MLPRSVGKFLGICLSWSTIEAMSGQTNNTVTSRVPEGYLAIPIHAVSSTTPLRVCVLVRRVPDPVAGHFVLLRDLPEAMVYLGCIADAGNRLREWIELWVQNVDGLEASQEIRRLEKALRRPPTPILARHEVGLLGSNGTEVLTYC